MGGKFSGEKGGFSEEIDYICTLKLLIISNSMKFNVSGKSLYSAASAVSKVINAKNALTILNNFYIELHDGTLSITGSDVENALTARISVSETEGEGAFCLDARRLVDLLKELPDQGIEVNFNEETLEVVLTYSNGRYSMVGVHADQYPQYQKDTDDEEMPVVFVCPVEQMIKGIETTIFAVGTEDFHPQMMGILLDIMPDGITFVATDTRKLVKYVNRMSGPGVTKRCILPVKPATIIKTAFAKEETFTVTITSKSATVETDNYTFNFRFIKGNFPDYNRVIPQNNPYILRVDRLRFLNAVRRVGVFVDPGFGLEKFRITADSIHLKSSDANMCTSGSETLECEYTGADLVIGFSAPYLMEICNTIPSEDLVVALSDPSRPGVFRPAEQAENTDLLVLLMPMNVTEF